MRILVDIRHLIGTQPSGVGEYTTQLLSALFEIDQENEYLLFSSGIDKPVLPFTPSPSHHSRFTHVHIHTPNKLLNLRALLFKHPTLNWRVSEPIDLIFLPNLNIATLPIDIPTVLMIHDLSFHHFPEFYSHKMRLWHKAVKPERLIKQAAHIITPSHATTQDVVQTFSIDQAHVTTIPHGFDPMYSEKMQASDHGVRSRFKLPKRYALFVGTLEPRKNLLGLIEGIKQYRLTTNDDLHLVLAGKWGWKSTQLRHRLYKRDVCSWVHCLDYVSAKDKPALYRSAEIFTWPSIYEGFGLPVLEAMASGTPVITSRNSSMPELTGNAAILVDPFNTSDIADALAQTLHSSTLRDTLRARGLARAAEFSWKKTAKATLSVFERQHLVLR